MHLFDMTLKLLALIVICIKKYRPRIQLESVPDKMNTYKLDDVAKDRRLNDSIRESHRYGGGFAPVFLPISH